MSAAPPDDFVAYVDRRLPQVRARVAGEVPAPDRDEVLTEVLTGLAGRWALLRVAARLGRPALTDRCVERLVVHRARLWRERQIYPVEVTVWDLPPAPPRPAGPTGPVSVALRRASVLDSTVRPPLAALAEASTAWWHAYEARRRAGRIVRVTLFVLFLLAIWTAAG